MASTRPIANPVRIQSRILTLRGERVLLDADLARLYGVSTGALVQAVKRNARRFPHDFIFQLHAGEYVNLKSHFVISSRLGGWGGRRRSLPHAFTEQGVAMLSSVLRSERAIRVNIVIMREFVRQRRLLASYPDLARKLDALERRYDAKFRVVFDAIRALMEPEPPPARRIGFQPEESTDKPRSSRVRR